jgi:hypothetical protein
MKMKMSNRILKATITLFAMGAIVFSVSFWPSAQSEVGASQTQNAKIRIPTISIWIGRASRGCRGFGICKITLGKVSPTERVVSGELSATNDGKVLLTLLGKAPEAGQSLFIDQDIPLSPEIAQKLGVKSATIQKGEYAFSANKSVLSARLTR